jgi:hypothetical protein
MGACLERRGIGHGEPGAGGRDAWVQWTGTCSSSSRLPSPARVEREERGHWGGAAGTATGAGCVCGASGRPGTSHTIIYNIVTYNVEIDSISSQQDLSKRPVYIYIRH